MRTNDDNPDPEDRVKAAGVSGLSDDRPWQPGEPAILDGQSQAARIEALELRLDDVEQVAASLIDRVKTLELERFAKQPPAAGKPEAIAKRCPFCGSSKVGTRAATDGCFATRCLNCGGYGPGEDTLALALDAWNRRV